ncbi:PREDICTED: protein SERAC1-like [Polistes canadensis]|uniref:protein SERAC1-like n=1 Tax=Polistes canadensis TaxID=91411 RepID=UPI000718FD93|nr:PREDICTED: protein SERAC1-like [Polistes canadensis]XP_014602803.1 PREDICTED: protein SERAC1-like [Polistes canadensis]XP_014602804.1 PREDICTED: protein SERAC1-like [Polistes canadensis]
MRVRTYKKCLYYLKSSGTCMVFIGGCWFLYQLRQTSKILRTTVTTDILNLEKAHKSYIYVDKPQYKDIFTFHNEKNQYVSERQSAVNHDITNVIARFNYNVTNIVTIMVDIIAERWKMLNQKLAYRLLNVARFGDEHERIRAATALCFLSDLEDWHYRNMAQMLDARTAIALARTPNVDQRFFLVPPYFHMEYKLHDVIEKVHNMLLHLNSLCDKLHPCLTQFLYKKFGNLFRDGLMFEHDLTSMGLAVPPTIIWNEELLQNCVQAIYHHSSLEQYSKDIVNAGGLEILMLIYKIFSNNIEMCTILANILSNISLHTEYLDDFFRSGWFGILVAWSKNKDIRLSVPAGCALANLDIDKNKHIKYPRHVYLLHPLHRTDTPSKLDVVFLHGLLGGVFITWRQRDIIKDDAIKCEDPINIENQSSELSALIKDYPQEFFKDLAYDLQMRAWKKLGRDYEVILDDCPINVNYQATGPFTCKGDDACMKNSEQDKICRTQCWPMDWLPRDVPYLRILGVNYDTNLSMWTPLCPIESLKSTISDRSNEYINKLLIADVGKRPIIWVCHSMGGLLVKKMLVEEWKTGDKHNICKNTRGIVFYSTPHRGSHIAALTQATQMLVWPSIEVQELREESPHLLGLHKDFLEMLKDYPMNIVSFSETKSTLVTALKLSFQFVTPDSADPGVGEFFEIPQDHLTICKPANRRSFLYQKLLCLLRHQIETRKESKNSTFMSLSLPDRLWPSFAK